MTDLEYALLKYLAAMPKGRAAYDLVDYDAAMEIAGPLIVSGHVIARRLAFKPGLQITDAGKAYIGGLT